MQKGQKSSSKHLKNVKVGTAKRQNFDRKYFVLAIVKSKRLEQAVKHFTTGGELKKQLEN